VTSGNEAEPVLRTQGLAKEFNGFRAVNDVDLTVEAGTVHALVGPNGAGKTTLFNLLTGFLRPTSGTITIDGRDVTGLRPELIAQRGVARSFQITSLFEELTLAEHVELALLGRDRQGYRFWRSDKQLRRYRDEIGELLDQVGLAGQARVPAASPTARNARSNSRSPWRCHRVCCCSTNRRPAWVWRTSPGPSS